MIEAISYFTPHYHGTDRAHPSIENRKSKIETPTPLTPDQLLALINLPVKYFSRMTAETQFALCAAVLALRSLSQPPKETALLAAGFDGTLAANTAYFQDYLTSGRSLARGNLFVYTLPTSPLSAISLALSLTGPALHLHNPAAPIATLLHHSYQMLADQEATLILALYTDPTAAICLAISPPINNEQSPNQQSPQPPIENRKSKIENLTGTPTQIAHSLHSMVPS